MLTASRLLAAAGLICVGPATVLAQNPRGDVTGMSIEDLLKVETVSTASKFPQEVREAPASITVVTAADITRYGHRTLSDVLNGVRGLYTTYDRNYHYIGARGVSTPGDYNTRVLLLLDGHRLNDAVYDMAPIGTEFPIAVSLIERVEIIRGPASSLYGTSAFFAVINIVTRSGGQYSGFRADVIGGSMKTGGVNASYGRLFATDGELLLAGRHFASGGAERLYYPEFDTGDPGSGTAVGLDDDESSSLFGSISVGHVTVRGGAGDRVKRVPTASFDAVFGDDRFTTTDRRAFLTGTYDGPVGRGWTGSARLAYDYYLYTGVYPTDDGGPEPVLWLDLARSHLVTGEVTARRRIARAHYLSVGAEVRHQLRSRMWTEDDLATYVDARRRATIIGIYAQDEYRPAPWMIVNAGARVDRYDTFSSSLTPRLSVVLLPRSRTAIKVLHGHAFRAPNTYELYYYDPLGAGGGHLQPERMRSTELVWEETLSNRVRTAVSAFSYTADRILELGAVQSGSGELFQFFNRGEIRGNGVEAEVEAKLPGGASGYASHSYVRASERGSEAALANSPRHLSKIGVQAPVSRFFVSLEGQYIGKRMTLAGSQLGGAFVPNVAVTSPEGRRVEITVGVYNASNTSYAVPGAEDFVQQAIAQDGRTVLAKMRVRF